MKLQIIVKDDVGLGIRRGTELKVSSEAVPQLLKKLRCRSFICLNRVSFTRRNVTFLKPPQIVTVFGR